ncbi:MAG: hypothetical protein V4692_16065 [Bdellovibrionota bacterium]
MKLKIVAMLIAFSLPSAFAQAESLMTCQNGEESIGIDLGTVHLGSRMKTESGWFARGTAKFANGLEVELIGFYKSKKGRAFAADSLLYDLTGKTPNGSLIGFHADLGAGKVSGEVSLLIPDRSLAKFVCK